VGSVARNGAGIRKELLKILSRGLFATVRIFYNMFPYNLPMEPGLAGTTFLLPISHVSPAFITGLIWMEGHCIIVRFSGGQKMGKYIAGSMIPNQQFARVLPPGHMFGMTTDYIALHAGIPHHEGYGGVSWIIRFCFGAD
jgi:hypothetical protein